MVADGWTLLSKPQRSFKRNRGRDGRRRRRRVPQITHFLSFLASVSPDRSRRRWTHFNSSPRRRRQRRIRQRQRERNVERGSLQTREGGREPGRTSTSSSSPSFRAGNPSVMRRWRSHWPSAYCHQTCTQLPCQGTDRETYHFPHCDRRTQR